MKNKRIAAITKALKQIRIAQSAYNNACCELHKQNDLHTIVSLENDASTPLTNCYKALIKELEILTENKNAENGK